MSEELLKLNGIHSEEAIDALVGMSFCASDLAAFESKTMMAVGGGFVRYQGITREGAAKILHRLWFMRFNVEAGVS